MRSFFQIPLTTRERERELECERACDCERERESDCNCDCDFARQRLRKEEARLSQSSTWRVSCSHVTDTEGERVGERVAVDSLRSLDGRIGGVDWRVAVEEGTTRSVADAVVAGEADMTVTAKKRRGLLTRYLFGCMRGNITWAHI